MPRGGHQGIYTEERQIPSLAAAKRYWLEHQAEMFHKLERMVGLGVPVCMDRAASRRAIVLNAMVRFGLTAREAAALAGVSRQSARRYLRAFKAGLIAMDGNYLPGVSRTDNGKLFARSWNGG